MKVPSSLGGLSHGEALKWLKVLKSCLSTYTESILLHWVYKEISQAVKRNCKKYFPWAYLKFWLLTFSLLWNLADTSVVVALAYSSRSPRTMVLITFWVLKLTTLWKWNFSPYKRHTHTFDIISETSQTAHPVPPRQLFYRHPQRSMAPRICLIWGNQFNSRLSFTEWNEARSTKRYERNKHHMIFWACSSTTSSWKGKQQNWSLGPFPAYPLVQRGSCLLR